MHSLSKTRSVQKRLQLLRNATKDQLLAVVEVASNVIDHKTFCFEKKHQKRIHPYEKYLKKLSAVSDQDEARKIVQKGGAPWMAALLVPVLLEVARVLRDRD